MLTGAGGLFQGAIAGDGMRGYSEVAKAIIQPLWKGGLFSRGGNAMTDTWGWGGGYWGGSKAPP